MMGFGTSLFCFYVIFLLTASLTAEPDYQRVITLHNQIVNTKSDADNLNNQINTLLGGGGNGISEIPATPVQAANIVHVLIREALKYKYSPEQFATELLDAYLKNKIKGGNALNHLQSVLIIYIAAWLDKELSEDQRTKQTYQILDQILKKYNLNIPSSEKIVKGELNQVGFFRLYNFFMKNPGAVKVMDVPLKPDEALNYERISSASPSSSRSSTPTALSPSSSSSHTPTEPPLSAAPDAPVAPPPPLEGPPSAPPIAPPLAGPPSAPLSSDAPGVPNPAPSHSSANGIKGSGNSESFLKHVSELLNTYKRHKMALEKNIEELKSFENDEGMISLKKQIETIDDRFFKDRDGIFKNISSAITHLDTYLDDLDKLKKPDEPQKLPDKPKARDERIQELKAQKENIEKQLKTAEQAIPSIGVGVFKAKQNLQKMQADNQSILKNLEQGIKDLSDPNKRAWKDVEEAMARYESQIRQHQAQIKHFRDYEIKMAEKPLVIALLAKYKEMLPKEKENSKIDTEARESEGVLCFQLQLSTTHSEEAQRIYDKDPDFMEGKNICASGNSQHLTIHTAIKDRRSSMKVGKSPNSLTSNSGASAAAITQQRRIFTPPKGSSQNKAATPETKPKLKAKSDSDSDDDDDNF